MRTTMVGVAPWVVAVLVGVSAAAGCRGTRVGGTGSARGGASVVRLTARDGGRRIDVRLGQRITVELPANPSTGYSWDVVSSGEPVVGPLGEPAFTASSHLPGAGGTLRYVFRAREAGTAELRLVYSRRWERDVAPADTFTVTVVVTR
jgi:inhibitor of cysteine peptidase